MLEPMSEIIRIYKTLLRRYGPQGWWPVTPIGETEPRYGVPIETDRQRLEVALGAILTQNTSWKNAKRAIVNLNQHELIDRQKLKRMRVEALAPIIRSAGYFNQKAKKIQAFVSYEGTVSRDGLLSIWGLGPETVDSILLYAHGIPSFVVDAYTRRYFCALEIMMGNESYDDVKRMFERAILQEITRTTPQTGKQKQVLVSVYREFHALIVAHAKQHYIKKPYGKDDPTR